MGYRVSGILKLPDGTPANNAEIEFISRKNFSPLVQDLKSNIRCSATGSYDVTLEYGEYAVIVYPGGTYPAALGTIILAADTVAGQDLPTLLQQAGWQPATPEYIQQITQWLVEANASASAALASELAAKVSEVNAKASEVAAESDRAQVAANAATVSLKHSEVLSNASQVSADASAAQSAKNTAVSASSSAQTSAASAAEDAAKAEVAAVKAEQAAQTVVGALIDAGPYNASTGALPTPVMSGSTKLSSIWKVTGNGTAGGIELGVGDSLVYTARDNSYYKIDNTESVAKVNNKTGVVVLNAEDVGAAPANAISASALPFPDVWLPLNDSLRLLAGFGDEIKVGDYTVATQARLTRNSDATLINKSGQLVNAAINGARFENEGLLVEPLGTNKITTSETYNPAVYGGVTSVSESVIMGRRFVKQVCNGSAAGSGLAVSGNFDIAQGDNFTYSAIFKLPNSGELAGRFRCRVGFSAGFAFDLSFYNELSIDRDPSSVSNVISKSQPFADKSLVLVERTVTVSQDYPAAFLQLQALQVEGITNVGAHQFELSSASSYIPTSGIVVTRAADKLTIPRLNNECVEWYSGADPITPIVTADTIELVPPAGERHLRNVRGFFTALTAEQKAALK